MHQRLAASYTLTDTWDYFNWTPKAGERRLKLSRPRAEILMWKVSAQVHSWGQGTSSCLAEPTWLHMSYESD